MRHTPRSVFAVVGAAALLTLGTTPHEAPAQPNQAWRLSETPGRYEPAVRKTEAAFADYQRRLLTRVIDVMSSEGAVAALNVYRDEDAALAQSIARQERFIRMGRTSHLLRNFRNAPPEWAAPYVTAAAAEDFVSSPTWVVEIGPAVGVLSPLNTIPTCTVCHGPTASLSREMLGAIRASYPGDRATGFTLGQVRGWIWAEVSSR